jgi:uncharacterized membrane protein
MPDTGEKTRRRRRASTSAQKTPRRGAKETAEDTAGTATETAEGAAGTAGDAAGDAADTARDKTTITGTLMDTVRGAAIEVLQPVVKEAATSAAKVAADKGPDLVKGKLGPAVASAGGVGGLAKMATDKGGDLVGGITDKLGGKGGKSPSGTGRGRRLPVQESIDVGVDLETAYDQWTQFEEFPRFMHRVEKIEQRDDTTLMWHENIWGVRRQWEAEIVEQIPCERIVWKSTGGPKVTGVVTFHRLSDTLTRIQVNMDFQPQGLFEKTASGFRMSRRALRSDLMRFKAYIEMRDEASGEWRGRIEDGEVVDEEDEGTEEEARFSKDDEEDEEEFEDEEEDEEEPVASEDEDEDLEEEEEEEEPPKKAPRKSTRKKAPARKKTRARS